MMTLCACVIPIFIGKAMEVDLKTGELQHDDQPFENWILAGLSTALTLLIMLGLYVGALLAVYGISNFQPT